MTYPSTLSLIDEQQKTIENLKRSNDSLKNFAYVCAHDMRQPLRTISNYMQLIALHHENCFDATTVLYFDNAINGVNKMDKLIKSILQYSTTTQVTQTFVNVNLNETLQSIQSDLFTKFCGVEGCIHIDPLPTIYGNETQMYQLFMNLIDNAMKFKSAKPLVISISAWEGTDHWVISMIDNGIGIDQKNKEAVFKMFTCVNHTEQASGSGIGLYLCKKIVEMHQGTITIDDNPTGGCVFEIMLPKTVGTHYIEAKKNIF
jgi:light-regulated signal transduction histidine kinase (bacteriophytochrome)